MAMAYDDAHMSESAAVDELKRQEKAFGVSPWCGLCGSTDLWFEHRPIPFLTLEDARPVLKRLEMENLKTMRFFADAPKPN
jgi:hypothetical protein